MTNPTTSVPAASAALVDVVVAVLINAHGWRFAGFEQLPAETFLTRGGRRVSVTRGVEGGTVEVTEHGVFLVDGRWVGRRFLGHAADACEAARLLDRSPALTVVSAR